SAAGAGLGTSAKSESSPFNERRRPDTERTSAASSSDVPARGAASSTPANAASPVGMRWALVNRGARLQQSIGNQPVQRLLGATRPGPGNVPIQREGEREMAQLLILMGFSAYQALMRNWPPGRSTVDLLRIFYQTPTNGLVFAWMTTWDSPSVIALATAF